jgi:hypothetical protein
MPTLSNGTTTLIPTGDYKAGTYNSQVYTLLVGQSHIVASADRNSWPATGSDVISLTVNVSFDSGNAFQLLLGFTSIGGDITNPWTQIVEAQSHLAMDVPQPDSPNRQIKATATLFTGINTAVSLTVS